MQSVESLPALPDSEDEDAAEVGSEPEQGLSLIRSNSDQGPTSVFEPRPVIRAASLPVVTEQLEVLEDRARTLQPDSQAVAEAEAMVRSPPPLRRSSRISLPIQRFSPY